MQLEERQHFVVEHIGRSDRRLGRIELGKSDLGIGVDEGLLVDTANALQGAHIERILGSQVARMGGFDLAAGFIIELLFLKRLDLGFSQYQTVSSDPGFKRLQPILEIGQLVANPDTADTGRRYKHTQFAQLVAGSNLTMSRILDRIFLNTQLYLMRLTLLA